MAIQIHPGDRRLMADLADSSAFLDDRGLELAEGFLHEQRQRDPANRSIARALAAVDGVRKLTKAP